MAKDKRARGTAALDGVPIFIRADPALNQSLDRLLEQRREQNPGLNLSKSALVRTLIWEAIHRERDR